MRVGAAGRRHNGTRRLSFSRVIAKYSRSKFAVAGAAIALLGAGSGIGSVALAGTQAQTAGTVYYACLKHGTLVNGSVGTTAPSKCPKQAVVISWNAQGPAGTDGNTILSGSQAPSGSVGVNGDFYLDTSTEVLYGPKAGGSWPATGTSLVGPAGAPPTPDLRRVATLNWYGAEYSGGSYGFRFPTAVAFDGTHIWVANFNNSVTEINAADGSLVRTITGGFFKFLEPTALAFDGTHIWVADYNNTVAEINAADGSLVRTLLGGSYKFFEPSGVAFDGTHIWVTNQGNSSVTEINAADGSLVRTISGGSYGLKYPYGVAFDGTHIWVTNDANSVTEINAADGSWVRTLSGASYGFNQPDGVAFDGTHIWVANAGNSSVTAVNAR